MLVQSWSWKHRAFLSTLSKELSACGSLINELNNISDAINSLNSTDYIRIILYGDNNFDNVTNFKIISATFKFIKTPKRLEEALFKILICWKYEITSLVNIGNISYGKRKINPY